MSKKGKAIGLPIVNARAAGIEPVGRLKVGRMYGKKFATQREAVNDLIDWLTFYNHRRLCSTLGYLSPMRFEENWHAGQAKKAA